MTPALYEAIGKVAIAYSHLDFVIVTFAGQLIASNHRIGQTIFGPMQMSRKIDALRTLFKLLPSVGCDHSEKALASLKSWDIEPVNAERVGELEGLLNRARAAGETRNNIMHALTWIQDDRKAPGDPVPTILKVKGGGLVEHEMPADRVENLATEIREVAQALAQFMSRHFRYADTWEPLLGRGTHWEVTVKGALSWYMKGGPEPEPGPETAP